jgi:hypothetical protein
MTAIEGITDLNSMLVAKVGEKIVIDDLEQMAFETSGEAVNDYDLKLVRAAIATQEAPFSFVYILGWEGTDEELDALFKSTALRHEWCVYEGEVYNARKSCDDPFWRYVGEPTLIGRFESEERAMGIYNAVSPELEWILNARDRRNGYLIEIGHHSYSPDGSEYSCGLVDSKVYFRRVGKTGRVFA